MIANTAFLAALTVFLLAAWLAGELSILAPYKAALFRLHGTFIAGLALIFFLNLCAVYYLLARWFFLRNHRRAEPASCTAACRDKASRSKSPRAEYSWLCNALRPCSKGL